MPGAKGLPSLAETPGPLILALFLLHTIAWGQGCARSGGDTRSPGPQPTTPSVWCSWEALPLAGGSQRSLRLRENYQPLQGTSKSGPGVSLRRETGERCGGLPRVPFGVPKNHPTHLSGTSGKDTSGRSYLVPARPIPCPTLHTDIFLHTVTGSRAVTILWWIFKEK